MESMGVTLILRDRNCSTIGRLQLKHIPVNSVYQKKHLEIMCVYGNVDIDTNNNDRVDVPRGLIFFNKIF